MQEYLKSIRILCVPLCSMEIYMFTTCRSSSLLGHPFLDFGLFGIRASVVLPWAEKTVPLGTNWGCEVAELTAENGKRMHQSVPPSARSAFSFSYATALHRKWELARQEIINLKLSSVSHSCSAVLSFFSRVLISTFVYWFTILAVRPNGIEVNSPSGITTN
jgi:hypothetical protein